MIIGFNYPVMARLDRAIHAFVFSKQRASKLDGPIKSGHDEERVDFIRHRFNFAITINRHPGLDPGSICHWQQRERLSVSMDPRVSCEGVPPHDPEGDGFLSVQCSVYLAIVMFLAAIQLSAPAIAQPSTDDGFYAGKQIKVIVGFPPGGGFDVYARTLAEHMPRHMPGNPSFIVQHMPGATTAKAAAHIYDIAAQDGTFMGLLHQGLLANQVLDIQGGTFDVTKFNWIGRMGTRLSVGLVWHTTGVKTIADAKKTEIIMGATSPTATSAMVPLALNYAAGTKFKVVMGYQGSADMYLAMERGETHGLGIAGWLDLTGPRADWVKDGKIAVLYQIALKRHADLPHIPVLADLASDSDDKQILSLLASTEDMGRSFVAGPNLPPARVETLRAAFAAMMADPLFLAEAQKRQLDIDFLHGRELQALVQNIGTFPADVAAKAKQILKPSSP